MGCGTATFFLGESNSNRIRVLTIISQPLSDMSIPQTQTGSQFARALQSSTAAIGAKILLEHKREPSFSQEVIDLMWLHNLLLAGTK
jgi:hypothetical protein